MACNWCYLTSCLVDFSKNFCLDSCAHAADGIDWQLSQGLFEEALVADDLSPYRPLLLESMHSQTCEGAALTAQLLLALLGDVEVDVPQWFLAFPDPSALSLSGWAIFFQAIQMKLQDQPCAATQGLRVLTSAAEALRPWRRGWQQAVAQRVVKDRLRRGFELLRLEKNELSRSCLEANAYRAAQVAELVAKQMRLEDWTSQRLAWQQLPAPMAGQRAAHQVAICVVGQPRAMAGRWLRPLALQLYRSLCPLAHLQLSFFFIFTAAVLPSLPPLELANCGLRGQFRLELHQDPPDFELKDAVEAYPEDAWWHGEGFGRLQWVRQMRSMARCQEMLDESTTFDWVVFLRPDLLHLKPLPVLETLEPGFAMIVPENGMLLAPHVGYLEGLDRALAMSGKVARAFLLEPLRALENQTFVDLYPQCLTCPAWRSPGVKLSPEKHLANVLLAWSDHTPLDLHLDSDWLQPLVLSETCVKLLPCEKQPCNAILPRWARELALRHTCWELKDRQAAELWASGGSIEPPDDFVAQALEEIFNYKP